MTIVRDAFGQELAPGDLVVWSAGMGMRIGYVRGVVPSTNAKATSSFLAGGKTSEFGYVSTSKLPGTWGRGVNMSRSTDFIKITGTQLETLIGDKHNAVAK